MTELEKQIQELRRENERLQKWVEDLEAKVAESERFMTWLKTDAFGRDQYNLLMSEYRKDTGGGMFS